MGRSEFVKELLLAEIDSFPPFFPQRVCVLLKGYFLKKGFIFIAKADLQREGETEVF